MGSQCFVPGAVIDLGRLWEVDAPSLFGTATAPLGPSPTTNWNRVSEKSSFVTLFNLGLLAPPSRR